MLYVSQPCIPSRKGDGICVAHDVGLSRLLCETRWETEFVSDVAGCCGDGKSGVIRAVCDGGLIMIGGRLSLRDERE